MDCKNCPLSKMTFKGQPVTIKRQTAMRHKLRFIMSHPSPSFIDREIFECPTTSLFERFIREPYDIVFTKNCLQAQKIETGKAGATALEREARARCSGTLAKDLEGASVIVACGESALHALGYETEKVGKLAGWIEWREDLQATVLATFDPHEIEFSWSLIKDWVWTVQKAEQIVKGLAPDRNILPEVPWQRVDTIEQFVELTSNYPDNEPLVIDIETTGLNWREDKVLQLGMYNPASLPLVITPQVIEDPRFKELYESLCNRMITVLHNGKFDTKFLRRVFGLNTTINEDTLITHHIIDERTGIHSLKRLCSIYLNWERYDDKIKHYLKMEGGYANAPFDELGQYLAYDLMGTYLLRQLFQATLRDDTLSKKFPWQVMLTQKQHLDAILSKVNNELLDAEYIGVLTDEERLDSLTAEAIPSVERRQNDVEQYIFNEIGEEVSATSPVQLQKAFHTMGILPEEIETVNAKVMKDYVKHGIVRDYLEFQKEKTILNNFYRKAKEMLVDVNGKKYTFANFNITGTIGSRWSGSEPNMQQAPRSPHPFKSIFRAHPGYVIFQNDFSALEVRMAAYLSKDKALAEACMGEDFHMTVAKSAFVKYFEEMETISTEKEIKDFLASKPLLLPVKKSTEEDAAKRGVSYSVRELKDAIIKHLRSCAKTITFGIFYGRGARALAQQELGCSIAEAQVFIDNYFKLFPDFQKFLNRIHYIVRDTGLLICADGRVRDLRYWMFSSDPMIRRQMFARACRQADNFMMQNMAGTVNNLAFVKAASYIKEHNIGRMIGAVHDSSVGEILLNKDTAMHMANIRELQNNCLQSDLVRFEVESEIGFNWTDVMKEKDFYAGVGDLVLQNGLNSFPEEEVKKRLTFWAEATKIRKMTPEELEKQGVNPVRAEQLEAAIMNLEEGWRGVLV